MQFKTDEHYAIGSEHVSGGKPCQDHALSGTHEDTAYAVVSDGCSSGGHTDMGARLISFSTAAAIREHRSELCIWSGETSQEVDLRQRIILGGLKETIRLKTTDMLATCIYAYLTPDKGIIHIRGDGVVAIVGADDSVTLYRFDWANNTPFYPAYLDDHYQSFVRAHGGVASAKALTSEAWEMRPKVEQVLTLEHSITDGIKGLTINLVTKDIAYVAVFTDGVTRVDGIDWKDAAMQLLAFKSAEGVFAKRRMNAFIKASHKLGKGPLDDIGYAVIRVVHNESQLQEGNHGS